MNYNINIIQQLHQILQINNKLSNYIVDIGASNGDGPTYEFITNKKYKGLCIEKNKEYLDLLKSKTSFDIYNDYIYPHNIIEVFQKFNVPIDIDILKIDIDGYDLEVLRKILEIYKPKIIIAEINEKIPPPILYEVKYKDNYEWDYSHCFGFSIKSGEILMNKYNYKIIEIYDLNNILCINEELCNILSLDKNNNVEELYTNQYINNLSRLGRFYYNENVNYWLEIKDPNILRTEIIKYFCENNDRSCFDIKTKILNVDFQCEF